MPKEPNVPALPITPPQIGRAVSPAVRRVGRPLDETAEGRILKAGIELYGREGWRGATMSAIAKEANVGKALLYSRFTNSADILVAAFETYITELSGEFDSIRELLLAEANRMAELYLGEHSLAIRRALIDAAAGIEPFPQISDDMSRRTILPMRRHIRAAIDRGELPPWTKVTQLLDVIEGAVRMHVFAAPHLAEKVRAGIGAYNEQLVDEQLLLLRRVGPLRGYPDTDWQPDYSLAGAVGTDGVAVQLASRARPSADGVPGSAT
jgi:AcrR family transcriptional regulator